MNFGQCNRAKHALLVCRLFACYFKIAVVRVANELLIAERQGELQELQRAFYVLLRRNFARIGVVFVAQSLHLDVDAIDLFEGSHDVTDGRLLKR